MAVPQTPSGSVATRQPGDGCKATGATCISSDSITNRQLYAEAHFLGRPFQSPPLTHGCRSETCFKLLDIANEAIEPSARLLRHVADEWLNSPWHVPRPGLCRNTVLLAEDDGVVGQWPPLFSTLHVVFSLVHCWPSRVITRRRGTAHLTPEFLTRLLPTDGMG